MITKMKSHPKRKHTSFFLEQVDFRCNILWHKSRKVLNFINFSQLSTTGRTSSPTTTSGGGGVDPVDVPAVLEIFSTSEGRWFVGLVVKQVGGDGWKSLRGRDLG